MSIIKTITQTIAAIFTDRTASANDSFVDWYAFASQMPAWVNNRTGETQTKVEMRLGYMVDRQATFFWQQLYGNTATPGEGGNPNAPFNRLATVETLEATKRQQLIDAGCDAGELTSDMAYANILIELHEVRSWVAFLTTELNKWTTMYQQLNDAEFKYEPYDEKPYLQQKQAASATQSLLQMIANK